MPPTSILAGFLLRGRKTWKSSLTTLTSSKTPLPQSETCTTETSLSLGTSIYGRSFNLPCRELTHGLPVYTPVNELLPQPSKPLTTEEILYVCFRASLLRLFSLDSLFQFSLRRHSLPSFSYCYRSKVRSSSSFHQDPGPSSGVGQNALEDNSHRNAETRPTHVSGSRSRDWTNTSGRQSDVQDNRL